MTEPTVPVPETVPTLLAQRRHDAADVSAIVADDATLTYRELDDASRSVAARLVAAGVVKGDRVGLLAPNTARWAVVAFGVMRIGAVLVPLSTLLRPPELAAQLRTAAVAHLVATPEVRGRRHLDELDTVAPGYRATIDDGGRHPEVPSLRRTWVAGDLWTPEPTGGRDGSASGGAASADGGIGADRAGQDLVGALEARVRPADDMVVLFTSGSTGSPKGVIHTHGGALRATAAGLGARRVGRGDRLYIPMPLFWTGGFSSGLITTAVAGATLVTESDP